MFIINNNLIQTIISAGFEASNNASECEKTFDMTITLNDICQMVIAIATVGTLGFTMISNIIVQRKKNKIELANIAYDIVTAAKEVRNLIDGDLDYLIIREYIWINLNRNVLRHFDYARTLDGNRMGGVIYFEENSKRVLLDPEKGYYFKITKQFTDNNDLVNRIGLNKVYADIIKFDNYISFFEFNLNYKLARYRKIIYCFENYINALKTLRGIGKQIFLDNDTMVCLEDFAKTLKFQNDTDCFDEINTKDNIDNYAKRLMFENIDTIEYIIKIIDDLFDELDTSIKTNLK